MIWNSAVCEVRCLTNPCLANCPGSQSGDKSLARIGNLKPRRTLCGGHCKFPSFGIASMAWVQLALSAPSAGMTESPQWHHRSLSRSTSAVEDVIPAFHQSQNQESTRKDLGQRDCTRPSHFIQLAPPTMVQPTGSLRRSDGAITDIICCVSHHSIQKPGCAHSKAPAVRDFNARTVEALYVMMLHAGTQAQAPCRECCCWWLTRGRPPAS